jgi:hypothetical protein
VVAETGTVERNRLDSESLRLLGDRLAHQAGCRNGRRLPA